MIELTAAVIGNPQGVDAVPQREFRIFFRLNAFDDHRHAGDLANAIEHVPIECGLIILAGRIAPALRNETL